MSGASERANGGANGFLYSARRLHSHSTYCEATTGDANGDNVIEETEANFSNEGDRQAALGGGVLVEAIVIAVIVTAPVVVVVVAVVNVNVVDDAQWVETV